MTSDATGQLLLHATKLRSKADGVHSVEDDDWGIRKLYSIHDSAYLFCFEKMYL